MQVKIQSVEEKWMEAQEKQRDRDDALVGTSHAHARARSLFLSRTHKKTHTH